MSTQPDALRLAGELDAVAEFGADPDLVQEAAAELRRLHDENQTLESAYQSACGIIQEQDAKLAELEKQRQALLEALKRTLDECIYPGALLSDIHATANAAIKAAEEQK